MPKIEVVDVDSLRKDEKSNLVSPMTRLYESVDGDYWMVKHVAKHFDVHVETIRRLVKAKINGKALTAAPRKAVRSGSAVIYLFDMADILELEDYFKRRGYTPDRPINTRKTLKEQTPE